MGRAMKDSGVTWIEEIPEGWHIENIRHRFSFGKGLPITKENLCDAGISVISYGQIHSKTNTGTAVTPDLIRYVDVDYLASNPDSLVKQEDFIFADTSEDIEGCGNCVYVNSDDTLFAGYHTIILRSLSCQSNHYLAYLFKCDAWRKQIRERVTGVKLFSISQKILRDVSILLPPLPEQSRIAAFLDRRCAEIDRVIAATQRSIEEYKKLKQSIITEAVTHGVRGERKMKDSGVEWIGEIPEEWKVIPAKFLFRNSDLRKQPDDELMTASQQYGIITQKQYMEITGAKVVLANQGIEDWKHVEPFDFIISLRSFQGGLEMSETTGCITWHYIVLKPCKPIFSYFFKWLFKSEIYIKALQRTCNFIRDGQDLRYSNFVQVPLFEPSIEEQREIADYLGQRCAEIDRLIEAKQHLLGELEAYKKSVIYEYVTGKREVPECQ